MDIGKLKRIGAQRKGTVMVEAAMIFPLVVAAVAAVIYIVIGLYSSLALQSSLHLDLRKECGESSETVFRLEKIQKFNSSKEVFGIRPVLRAEEARVHRIGSLFKQSVTRKETGRSYIIDEAELIRLLSLWGEEP